MRELTEVERCAAGDICYERNKKDATHEFLAGLCPTCTGAVVASVDGERVVDTDNARNTNELDPVGHETIGVSSTPSLVREEDVERAAEVIAELWDADDWACVCQRDHSNPERASARDYRAAARVALEACATRQGVDAPPLPEIRESDVVFTENDVRMCRMYGAMFDGERNGDFTSLANRIEAVLEAVSARKDGGNG